MTQIVMLKFWLSSAKKKKSSFTKIHILPFYSAATKVSAHHCKACVSISDINLAIVIEEIEGEKEIKWQPLNYSYQICVCTCVYICRYTYMYFKKLSVAEEREYTQHHYVNKKIIAKIKRMVIWWPWQGQNLRSPTLT